MSYEDSPERVPKFRIIEHDRPAETSTPKFIVKGTRKAISLAEATEIFGDPAANVHPEEDSSGNVELLSPTGHSYAVHLGLPAPEVQHYGASKQYWPPFKPHVFKADRFRLSTQEHPSDPIVDEADVRVLYMHGRRNANAWVPSDPELEQKGVTVPTLLSSFEATTGLPIDIVWTCQVDPAQRTNKLEANTGHPYVYPASGYAHGTVRLERGELSVSLAQSLDEHSHVEYEEWLDARS